MKFVPVPAPRDLPTDTDEIWELPATQGLSDFYAPTCCETGDAQPLVIGGILVAPAPSGADILDLID